MAQYRYTALDKAGREVAGSTEAKDYAALVAALEKSGLFVVKAAVHGQAAKKAHVPAAAAARKSRASSVPLGALSFFTGQLAVMLRSAVPAGEAVEALSRREENAAFRAALLGVGKRLERGESLSQALASQPDCFDAVYVALVASGEARGDVATVLDRVDSHLTFQTELRRKLRSVLIYPVVVSAAAAAVVLFILLFVMPTFVDVFQQFDAPLPPATRALLALSDHIQDWWVVHLALLAGAAWFLRRKLRQPAVRARLDRWALGLPVVGPLIQSVVLTRILRTLATLVEGGVPILEALALTKGTAGNAAYEKLLEKMSVRVSEGKGLASALFESPYVPPAVASTVATAEKTRALPEVLDKVSGYYERRTEGALEDLMSALEPLCVGVVGLLVAGLAASVLLPIFNLSSLGQ